VAIVSLVAGLLGWTFAPWLGSIIAIITGHMARAEIRRDPAGLEGDGLAVAGLVLGWAMILLSVFTVVAIVLFFGGIAALAALTAGISA
jgi:ABC-type antimicrobial peptide transport system permease subunit